MRKLWVKAWMTLDGVFDAETMDHWWQNTDSPERMQHIMEEYANGDAYLLGRVTYEEFAAAWPAMEETTGEFGAKMNAMPKVVVSTTLADPAWKNTTVDRGDDLPGLVADLKQRYDGDILVAGSATLVAGLREHDLVDEYRLMVHPVLIGQGKRLFGDGSAMTDLVLTDSRNVGPDVLLLTYRPTTRDN